MNQFCPDCPTQTVFDPPVTAYNNYYHPQLVNVIQPVEIINQHHCVPVYQHHTVFTSKDVMCSVSSVKRNKKSKKRNKRA